MRWTDRIVIASGILVIVGIAAVTGLRACGWFPGAARQARRPPGFLTRKTLAKVGILAEDWKRKFEAYPPGDVGQIPAVAGVGGRVTGEPNLRNAGIEALYAALLWPGFPDDPAWRDDQVSNTDVDRLSRPVTKDGDPRLYELCDAWGSPLVYFRADDYARYAEHGAAYVNTQHDQVVAKPIRRADGTFLRPDSFQLFSMGADGRPNTADDLVFGAD